MSVSILIYNYIFTIMLYICLLCAKGKSLLIIYHLQLYYVFVAIGNFVPFAMGSGGNRASGDHAVGNKTPVSPSATANANSQQANQTRKKGRIDVKDVFNNDDDDDAANTAKKRKLVPLGKCFTFVTNSNERKLRHLQSLLLADYGEDKKKKTEETTKSGKEESTKSQEEKRKHIKSLIDKIPTDKNALFGYQLDWAVIDNVSINYIFTNCASLKQ